MSDKIKTLSQAIRLGATFRPKCEHVFKDGASCTFGFGTPRNVVYEVVHRNNGTNGFIMQTREAIADWLESIGL